MPLQIERLFKRLNDSLNDPDHIMLPIRSFQQHRKFITAHPGNRILWTNTGV